jgi:hypothetical protein
MTDGGGLSITVVGEAKSGNAKEVFRAESSKFVMISDAATDGSRSLVERVGQSMTGVSSSDAIGVVRVTMVMGGCLSLLFSEAAGDSTTKAN